MPSNLTLNYSIMNKLEQEMVRAIRNRRNWRMSNTRVEVIQNAIRVYLHENLIARIDLTQGVIEYYDGGWQTRTTKSRLNALGANISQKRGVWYVHDRRYLNDFPFHNGYTKDERA